MPHGQEATRPNTNPLDLLQMDEFAYLFPEVALDPDAKLPTDAETIAALKRLGDTMTAADQASEGPDDVLTPPGGLPSISAPYTYLGQFIDHDITLTVAADPTQDLDNEIARASFDPIDPRKIRKLLRNARSSAFDLDSIYGLQPDNPELAVPFSGDKFVLGSVTGSQLPANVPSGTNSDLPRVGGSGPLAKRARIGDPRNDENLIVAQLLQAFLRFHNAVIDDGIGYDAARELVTRHYQWLVLTDFLPRVCDRAIVRRVIERGNALYEPPRSERFMPVEFAMAMYRFGHSMVRARYDYNSFFPQATLQALFDFTGLKGNGIAPTLPSIWVADWARLLRVPTKQLDPTITSFVMNLPADGGGVPAVDVMKKLATRNLLRGYLMALPTGQALAATLLMPADLMTPAEVLDASRDAAQRDVVETARFHEKTPLWYYILAEAKVKGGGNRLGPLGSLIVAETLVGLIRQSRYSVLEGGFVPTLGDRIGQFDLQDLLKKAGVLQQRVG